MTATQALDTRARPRAGPGRGLLIAVATLYPALLLGLSAAQLVSPRRTGVLALTQVFAPYLFLPLLALLPLVFLRRAALLRLALAACCVVAGVRFAPPLHRSPPAANPTAAQLTVLTWNVYLGNARLDEVRGFLRTKPADVVALQEVGDVDLLVRDADLARLYPHRLVPPRTTARPRDIIILSAYPIVAAIPLDNRADGQAPPPVFWARLDLGQGRRLTVVTAHPTAPDTSPRTCRRPPRPICFAPGRRDAQIAQVRATIAPFLQSGEPLLVVGDFNVTDREPTYRDLTAGLRDAHASAGRGFGHTWHPSFLPRWEPPLLRIDYLLSSPNVTPLATGVDCTPRGSDHCGVSGHFAVE